jgi:tetratricopeptide (TPR) repeat protein
MEAYEHYLRGRQLVGQFSQRTIMQAPDFFRRAIALDPGYAQAHAGLADALAQQAQWRFAPAAQVMAEGTVAANRALDLAPELAEAHLAQGHLRSVAGDADGARRAFERALELNPSLFDAWHYYARDCYSRGEYARAAELFQRAHRVRPDDFTPLVFASSSLHALGDEPGSRALAERAANGLLQQCELEPDNLRAHYLAGGVLLQVGRREEGLRLSERALAMAPEDFSALYNAACFHSLAGEPERALDLLERALAKGNGFPTGCATTPTSIHCARIPASRRCSRAWASPSWRRGRCGWRARVLRACLRGCSGRRPCTHAPPPAAAPCGSRRGSACRRRNRAGPSPGRRAGRNSPAAPGPPLPPAPRRDRPAPVECPA